MMRYSRNFCNNQTIPSNLYCSQLRRLKTAFDKKYYFLVNGKGITLHHDNARPHTAQLSKDLIEELGWEMVISLFLLFFSCFF